MPVRMATRDILVGRPRIPYSPTGHLHEYGPGNLREFPPGHPAFQEQAGQRAQQRAGPLGNGLPIQRFHI